MNQKTAMQNVIVSGTAKGSGSDKYRWVSGLSKGAKSALSEKSGLVICPRRFSDNQGEWYVVTVNRGRYDHRLPNAQESAAIKAAGL